LGDVVVEGIGDKEAGGSNELNTTPRSSLRTTLNLWGSSPISEFSKVKFLHPKSQTTDWLCNEDKAPLTSVQILN
jgi:hypothetical protein